MPQLLRRLTAVSVHILGKTITTVTVAKDLGIYIDQSLTYNDHITKIVSTWLHKLIQINRIKQLIDTNTLRLLLGSFVFSKLYECSSVWSNTSKRNIKKLQLVQNLAARIVFGPKNVDHSSPGIKSLNWLPVSDKLYLNDAVMMFKYILHSRFYHLAEKFNRRSQIHTRSTRQSSQLSIPRCHRAVGQRSFSYWGAKLWHGISDNVKSND